MHGRQTIAAERTDNWAYPEAADAHTHRQTTDDTQSLRNGRADGRTYPGGVRTGRPRPPPGQRRGPHGGAAPRMVMMVVMMIKVCECGGMEEEKCHTHIHIMLHTFFQLMFLPKHTHTHSSIHPPPQDGVNI